ncbi:MAG: hypothetical protein ACLU4J_10630 [Butyricimonas paravirosa]
MPGLMLTGVAFVMLREVHESQDELPVRDFVKKLGMVVAENKDLVRVRLAYWKRNYFNRLSKTKIYFQSFDWLSETWLMLPRRLFGKLNPIAGIPGTYLRLS